MLPDRLEEWKQEKVHTGGLRYTILLPAAPIIHLTTGATSPGDLCMPGNTTNDVREFWTSLLGLYS